MNEAAPQAADTGTAPDGFGTLTAGMVRETFDHWLREHMPACGAREGRVELVVLGTDTDLASRYVPTGTAWRAVLTSNGRVLLYPVRPVTLTRRERQVAELVAAGMTSKQIARQLCIARRTVDAHLQAAYAKTGTGTRIRLANWLRA